MAPIQLQNTSLLASPFTHPSSRDVPSTSQSRRTELPCAPNHGASRSASVEASETESAQPANLTTQPGCTAGVRRGKVGQMKLHRLLTLGKPSLAEPGAPLGDNAFIPRPTSGTQSSFSAFLQTRVLPDHITFQAFSVRASSNLSSFTKAFS